MNPIERLSIDFDPTDQQRLIFEWATGHGPHAGRHLQVIAGPGSGKTATALVVAQALVMRPGSPVAVFAFNADTVREWAAELCARLGLRYRDISHARSLLRDRGVRVSTLDGLALSVVSRASHAVINGEHVRNPWRRYTMRPKKPDFHLVRIKHHTRELVGQYDDKLKEYVTAAVVAVMQSAPFARSPDDARSVIVARGLGLSAKWQIDGFDNDWLADHAWRVFEKCVHPGESTNDPHCMLSFPELSCIALRYQLYKSLARFPFIVGDEFQDASHAQIQLVWLSRARKNGRLCLVGDPRQAIYAWRGAAAGLFRNFPDSVNMRAYSRSEHRMLQRALTRYLDAEDVARIGLVESGIPDAGMVAAIELVQESASVPVTGRICQTVLDVCARADDECKLFARQGPRIAMVTMPLTVSFRCARSIVQYAQRWMPEYRAADGAPTGSFGDDTYRGMISTAGPDSFIVSRTRAGAAQAAFALLARGTPVVLSGAREDRSLILRTMKSCARGVSSMAEFKLAVNRWATAEMAEASDTRRMDTITDLRDVIMAVTARSENIAVAIDTITSLYQKPSAEQRRQVVYCSTVHGVKGLESPHVWILGYTFDHDDRPPPDPYNLTETERLWFVAATRAKSNLRIVRTQPE